MSRAQSKLISAVVAFLAAAAGCNKSEPVTHVQVHQSVSASSVTGFPIHGLPEEQKRRAARLVDEAFAINLPDKRLMAAMADADAANEFLGKTLRAIRAAEDLVLQNMTNLDTTGYKAIRCQVTDGKVVRQFDFEQGKMDLTNQPLDVCITGNGFFAIQVPEWKGGVGYTRNGNFSLNGAGELVVNSGDGYKLIPSVTLPIDADNIEIKFDGTVQYFKSRVGSRVAGQLKLGQFPNVQGLVLQRGGIYTPTDASGPAFFSTPGNDGTGSIRCNYLEAPNVEPDRERLRLSWLKQWRESLEIAVADRSATPEAQTAAAKVSPQRSARQIDRFIDESSGGITAETRGLAALAAATTATEHLLQTLRVIRSGEAIVLENVCNAQTIAYKATRLFIEDADGRLRTQLVCDQGSMQRTGRALDVAIAGEGYLAVKIVNSMGGTGYTRNGSLFVNNRGELVFGLGDGYKLIPQIKVPVNATQVSITRDGTVQFMAPDTQILQIAGRLKLTVFPNPHGIKDLGGGIYTNTDSSGAGIVCSPQTGGAGQISSNCLEASNVDLDYERARLRELMQWRHTVEQAIAEKISKPLPQATTGGAKY